MKNAIALSLGLVIAVSACGPAEPESLDADLKLGTGSARVVTTPADTIIPTQVGPDGLAVGLSKGASSVSPDGTAKYTLPLWVPDGRAGMQPALTLSYQGNSGSNMLGQGWSITGLSAVARCPRTLAQDGRVEGISFTSADAFCLDGQRLIAIQGGYGASGTEYRTEQESFSKVVSLEADGSGPALFKVYLKDGRVMTYGKLNNSTLAGERGSVRALDATGFAVSRDGRENRLVWALSQVEDRSGNFMSFQYAKTQDPADGSYEQTLSRIAYTGSSLGAGRPAYRFVDFDYGDHTNPRVVHLNGLKTKASRRLKEIRVSGPNPVSTGLVRAYRFTYLPPAQSSVTRLASFQECDGAGVCLPAVTFSWTPESDLFEDVDTGITDILSPPTSAAIFRALNPMDVDGDGFDDLLYRTTSSQSNSFKWVMRYGSAAGYGAAVDAVSLPNACWDSSAGHNGKWADVNMDGLPDVSILQWNACVGPGQYSELKHFRRTNLAGGRAANSFQEVGNDGKWGDAFWYADLNGDAYPELVRVLTSTRTLGYRPNVGGALQPFQPIVTSDLNDNTQFALNLDGSSKTSLLFIEMRRPPGPHDIYAEVGKRYWSMTQRPDGTFAKQETTLVRSDVDLLPDGTPFDHGPEGDETCNNCYNWQYLFVDLTGDSLPDAVRAKAKTGGDLEVLVNTGDGFAPPVPIQLPVGFNLAPFTRDNGIRVLDFDQDGRQDLLLMDDGAGTRGQVALLQSVGTGFATRFLGVPVAQAGGLGVNLSQLLDANGDGLMDLAQIVNGRLHVYLRKGPPAGLLTGVSDSLGARIEFSYKPMSDASVYTPGTGCSYPQVCVKKGQWLVSEHRVDTGSPVMHATRYSYGDGRADLLGRGWLGFARMTAKDLVSGTESRVDFDNQTREGTFYPLAGTPVFQVTTMFLPGRLHLQVRATQHKILAQGTSRVDARLRVFPEVITEEVYDRLETNAWNAGLLNRVVSVLGFDETYGNVLNRKQMFSNGDEMEWVTGYQNDPVNWLVGLPIQESQTSTVQGVAQVRRLSYEYKPGTVLLKKTTVEPNDPILEVVTEQIRDDDGLLTEVRTTGVGMVTRSTLFTYDALERVHPASVINSLGHTVTHAYHPSLGLPAVKVDENGLTTRWQYDGFGRVRKLDNPDAADVSLSYVPCPNEAGCAYQVQSQTVQGQEERTNLDRLGRTLSVSKRAFNDADGWITSRREFDLLGRVSYSWAPSPTGSREVSTSFTYDALGRPLVTTYPDGSKTLRRYIANQVNSFDEKNNLQVSWLDVYGRTASVDDYVDGRKLTTTYRYGPFGNPAGVLSADGTGPTFKYDRQGRRVEVNDPDSGLSISKYNALGELTESKDANGDTTQYEHDLLGRVTKTTNRDGVSTYIWDNAIAGNAGIGKLYKSIKDDLAGTAQSVISTKYAYDSFGRPVEDLWTIGGSQYAIGRQYDAYSRLSQLQYPQVGTTNFAVNYEYTARGSLKRVRAANNGPVYWSVEGRNGLQQLTAESFGNGVSSLRRYDTRGRLLFIQGTHGSQELQKLAYEYEPNGNVRSRHDRHDPLRMSTEDFTYDALDRVKSWTVFQNCQSRTANYGYDDLGNLLSRQGMGENISSFYERTGGAGPHAVTRSSFGSYTYDASGNQLTAPGRTVTYTTFGLPSRVVTGTGNTEYRYDSMNARVVKSDSSGESTFYVGGLFEERRAPNGAMSRVFNVLGDAGTVAQLAWATDALGNASAPKTTYLHTDALGSVATLSDEMGGVTEQLRYEPFGGRRLAQSLANPVVRGTSGVRQGFTGHEHEEELGLINMKGRIYEPSLGRFLSPDRLLPGQAPSQALNRYSYVLNNPLKYVDPSGWLPLVMPIIVYDSWYGGYVTPGWAMSRVVKWIDETNCNIMTPTGQTCDVVHREEKAWWETGPSMSAETWWALTRLTLGAQGAYYQEALRHGARFAGGAILGGWVAEIPLGAYFIPMVPGQSSAYYQGYAWSLDWASKVESALGMAATFAGMGGMSAGGMMLASGGAAGAGIVVEGISVSAVAAGAGAAVAAVANAEGAKNALQMANQAGGGRKSSPNATKQVGQQTSLSPEKSIESLRDRMAEHEKKLADYRANPDAFDNEGFLKNAPSPEVRQKIIDGRIKHLGDEIRAFAKAITDLGGTP
ncbi:RHS repeat-associated core domain-containing protein [Corallococcus caeni]|uniref:RHS repeat-associated core domain-containing protein n=1 Tax=Corallococcus caeni TaxID=3082388 RepID=UPI0030C76B75